MSRKLLLLFIPVIILTLAASVITFQYYTAVYQPLNSQSEETVNFTIASGESGVQVALRLSEKGLIRSDLFARIFFRLQQREGQFLQAGEYSLSSAQSLSEMFELFQHGTFDVAFTIPEGKRLEEAARIVSQSLDITSFEFYGAAANSENSEGKLFPDTYRVPSDINTSELVDFMLENFEEQIDSKIRDGFKQQGLTFNEALIIASIVEREAKLEKDRPLIAGILIKRFLSDWLLEADATVQYAKASLTCQLGTECNWWPNDLTEDDLKIDSWYNTRLKAGLPPAPICSPGLASLKAVAEPEETAYWFYLSDNTGKTYYSVSYEEHLIKVAQILQ